jgi:hypothetical protein
MFCSPLHGWHVIQRKDTILPVDRAAYVHQFSAHWFEPLVLLPASRAAAGVLLLSVHVRSLGRCGVHGLCR